MQYIVRQATLEDVESMVQLRERLYLDVGEPVRSETAAAVADANRRFMVASLPAGEFVAWVAEADGAVVASSGMVWLRRPPSPGNLGGLEGYIMNMYTLPEWRGQGIARALLDRLVEAARQAGAACVRLHASEAGRPIYAKAGFEADDTAMDLALS